MNKILNAKLLATLNIGVLSCGLGFLLVGCSSNEPGSASASSSPGDSGTPGSGETSSASSNAASTVAATSTPPATVSSPTAERHDLSGIDLTVNQGPAPDLSDARTSLMEYAQLSPLMPKSIGKFSKSDMPGEKYTYHSEFGYLAFDVEDRFGRKPAKEVTEFAEGETQNDSFNWTEVNRKYLLSSGGPMVHERELLFKTRFGEYADPDQSVLKLFNDRFVVSLSSYSKKGPIGGVLSGKQLMKILQDSHLWKLIELPGATLQELGTIPQYATADDLLPVADVARVCGIEAIKTQDQPDPNRESLMRFYKAKGKSPLLLIARRASGFNAILESIKERGGRLDRLSGLGDKSFFATYDVKYASSNKSPTSYRLVFTRGPYLVELTSTGETYTDQYVATESELKALAKVVDTNLEAVIERASSGKTP